MSLSLEQILIRLDDPETPVIWLDPSLPEDLWRQLPPAARFRGFHILNLDEAEPVFDLSSLLAAFARLLPPNATFDHSFPSLRHCLLHLASPAPKGFLVLFPHPESLRQNDERAFEEFMELMESIHDVRHRAGRGYLKAVVRD